ncbi:MAG TPA: FecR family protein, partial [Longimicrobiales bacterium]|nr:FecR family protein [Longimicrobiales bacterium]
MNELMKASTRARALLAATFATFALAADGAAQSGDVALVHALMLDRELVVSPADAQPVRAELGHRLRDRDAVFTSANTRAAIRFTDDGSLVRLNPNSQLQVLATGERSALAKTIELEFGELWARVTRRPETDFQVRTPAGVAAVKGTELLVLVGQDGATTVMTLEGEVEFTNDGGAATITAGNRVSVTSIADPPVAQPITDAEREALGELVEEEEDPSTEVQIRL